jgi:beta-N-acetylhexosaminidase
MTSHTLYPALDPDNPGTFSSTILRNLLRAQLGFDGVLITDDLEMGAVVERYSQADAPIAALQAGADLLLVCNDLEKMHLTAEVVLDGLNRGMLDSHDLSLSLTRLVKLRKMYLDPPHLADVATVAAHFST